MNMKDMELAVVILNIMNMNAHVGRALLFEEHDNIPGFRDHDDIFHVLNVVKNMC